MSGSSPATAPADLLLLTPGGGLLGEFTGVSLPGTMLGALLQVARALAGREVWLLHDGGIGLGRRDLPARFEVPGATASAVPAPALPSARPWQRPGWRGAALAWIKERLGEPVTGAAWVHTTDVGAVLTARVGRRGQVFLKAGEDGREALASRRVAERLPGLTPTLLAADPGRGWLLSADAGHSLLDSARLHDWTGAVQALARVHREARFENLPTHAFADLPDRLERLLAPEARLHWGLSGDQAALGRHLPRFRALHRTVTARGLDLCACHGDVHANNVPLQGERLSLFDWSEACTAHPLTDIGWFLAFIMLPTRADLALRREHPQLGEQLWAAYRRAAGTDFGLPWQDVAWLALLHRAVVYDARFRDWTGTLPGLRPQYVPYSLHLTRHFGPAE